MDSVYWVLSRDCNQRCPHCYNHSQPGAPGLTLSEVDRCVANLPDPADVAVGRVILSGGEVLVWPELLFHALRRLRERFDERTELWVQTNGDLLDDGMLQRLLDHSVCRIDVASMDRFHKKTTLQRRDFLEQLFVAFGMVSAIGDEPVLGKERADQRSATRKPAPHASYAFWGANEDEWIGPIWPRGRAQEKKLSKAGPEDRFCSMWSGAKNFLEYRGDGCEINLQLSDVYPCCPMTFRPIGSLLQESLTAILDRCRNHSVFAALNEGRPEALGESLGLSEEFGYERSRQLGNHCLWCDEFFAKYAPEILLSGSQTERGTADLVQIGWSAETN